MNGLITDSPRLMDGVNPQTVSVRRFPFRYQHTVDSSAYYIHQLS